MKIKSAEKLQDLIDSDIAWRKKELIEMRSLIHITNNPVYVRAGLALLCAHFEGFIKQASNYYIVYISDQKISNLCLSNNFIALQIKQKLSICASSDKTSVHAAFVNEFKNVINSNFFVKYSQDKPIISTQSNPSSTVFEEIVKSIGLDFSLFETKKKYIDTDLLSNRHKIVHGEKTSISIGDFDETFKNIVWIIEEYRNLIYLAVAEKQYLTTT